MQVSGPVGTCRPLHGTSLAQVPRYGHGDVVLADALVQLFGTLGRHRCAGVAALRHPSAQAIAVDEVRLPPMPAEFGKPGVPISPHPSEGTATQMLLHSHIWQP